MYFILPVLFLGIFFARTVYAGTLACAVRTLACSGGEVDIFEMQSITNAHAGTPTSTYTNLVCCGGVTGIATDCTGTFATVLKLSGGTNAHVQQTGSYEHNVCIQVPSGGSVSVGYASDCTTPVAYDTTLGLASMSSTSNAHVGNNTAYVTKICASAAGAAAQSLTFSISDSTIGFGTLNNSVARYATGDTLGAATDVADAHTLSATTNASGGYVITINGTTLTSGANTVTAIGATAVASNPTTEQFGTRLIVNSGTGGSVSAPYNTANWALETTAFPDQVASGSGDSTEDVFGVRYIANIAGATEAGSYSAALTYVATATF